MCKSRYSVYATFTVISGLKCHLWVKLRTQHIGGHANPDGVADAQVGPLAYRVMLECKRAGPQ